MADENVKSNATKAKEPVWPIGNNMPVSIFGSKYAYFGTQGQKRVPVYAYRSGTVIYHGPSRHNDGFTVTLKHKVDGKQIYSSYGKLDSVVKGLEIKDKVKAGQQIGVVGTKFGCLRFLIGLEFGQYEAVNLINPFTENKNDVTYLV